MKKETLVQVRNYLEERRIESLNYLEIEIKEEDSLMLDLARMVVEEKIRDVEPKQGAENIKVTINTIDISEKVNDAARQIRSEFEVKKSDID